MACFAQPFPTPRRPSCLTLYFFKSPERFFQVPRKVVWGVSFSDQASSPSAEDSTLSFSSELATPLLFFHCASQPKRKRTSRHHRHYPNPPVTSLSDNAQEEERIVRAAVYFSYRDSPVLKVQHIWNSFLWEHYAQNAKVRTVPLLCVCVCVCVCRAIFAPGGRVRACR